MELGIEITEFTVSHGAGVKFSAKLTVVKEKVPPLYVGNVKQTVDVLLRIEPSIAKNMETLDYLRLSKSFTLSESARDLLIRLQEYDYDKGQTNLFNYVSVYNENIPDRIFFEGDTALNFLAFLKDYPFVDMDKRQKTFAFNDKGLTIEWNVMPYKTKAYFTIAPAFKVKGKTLASEDVYFAGDYIISDNTFFRPVKRLDTFKALFKRNTKTRALLPHTVTYEELPRFMRDTYPKLNDIAPLTLPESIPQENAIITCVPVLYLDYDKHIYGYLTFRYGKEEMPLPKRASALQSDKDVIYKRPSKSVRDEKKEKKIQGEARNLLGNYQLFEREGVDEDEEEGVYTFTIVSESVMFEFIQKRMPTFKEEHKEWKIVTTHAYELFATGSNYTFAISIDKKENIDWFEMNFTTQGVSKKDVGRIISALEEQREFVRLKNGAFLNLQTEEVARVRRLIDEHDLKPDKSGRTKLSRYQVIELSRGARDQKWELSLPKTVENLLTLINTPPKTPAFPKKLEKTLRPYQKEGVTFLTHLTTSGFNCILADEMGLGKTLQALTYLAILAKAEKERKPALVVCPASLVFNWIEECEKFTPDLAPVALHGNANERKRELKRTDVGLFVTSYHRFVNDIDIHHENNYTALILDEAQNIKNHTSKRTRLLKTIAVEKRIALTGTPLENRLDELWSIFDFLMPSFLRDIGYFRERYVRPIENGEVTRMEVLRKRVRPFILQRKKEHVAKELPPRVEQVLHAEMDATQKSVYVSIREAASDAVHLAIMEKGFNKSKMSILSALTRLKQACCHPRLLLKQAEDAFDTENKKVIEKAASAKTELFLELADEIVEGGHRTLVFSQFTSMLDILETSLTEKGYAFIRLDGKTRDRKKVVNAFQKEDGPPFFLISLKAGGVGLNLTQADTVILYDLWWNPAAERQAMDRAHRIGQTKTVNVYRLVVKGTIEDHILKLQRKKSGLAKDLLEEGDFSLSSLTEADIKQILS